MTHTSGMHDDELISYNFAAIAWQSYQSNSDKPEIGLICVIMITCISFNQLMSPIASLS